MNVLVMYEASGVVREAFRKAGHNAWSLTGWKGGKPIVRQLEGTDDRSTSYRERRTL